ncbi:unnamed protein product [Rotaria socialis]
MKQVLIPGHYCLFSNDLDSLTSSEEQQIMLNNINNMPKLVPNERAFINIQTNSIEETYPYTYDGSTHGKFLCRKSLVLCIAVVYEREAAIQMTFVFTTKILQRSLAEENIDEHTELKDTDTDLALLMLDNEIPNITEDQYLNPKFDFVSLKSGDIPINSKLYLVGYNGELGEQQDFTPYKYLEDFNNSTIYQLNHCHHVNYKSISIGHLIREACQNNPYFSHNCSTLPGSSGSIVTVD